jgi:DNA processing protein
MEQATRRRDFIVISRRALAHPRTGWEARFPDEEFSFSTRNLSARRPMGKAMTMIPCTACPGDPLYPPRLLDLPDPPPILWVAGPLPRRPTVAIVGTRHPVAHAEAFAGELGGAVAAAGGIVISGGAVGIDAAAHRGALARGGRTWAVLPTGHAHVYPQGHAELYERVVASKGAVIWPFPPDTVAMRHNFLLRNEVLAALADTVVVVQAGIPSGALNAAKWARKLSRPLWLVAAAPWMSEFRGCQVELERGRARPLTSIEALLASVNLNRKIGRSKDPDPNPFRPSDLPVQTNPRAEPPLRPLSLDEKAILNATSAAPKHADEIALQTGLPARTLSTLLLTLALENVVVEGPDGYFRRRCPI